MKNSALHWRANAAFALSPMAFALLCMAASPIAAQTQPFPILPTWRVVGEGPVPYTVRGGTVQVGAISAGSPPGTLGQPVNSATGVTNTFGTVLPITQTSNRAIIDWQGFSIGAGNRVDISQPGRASILLNRVVGTDLSTIAGALNANGRIFLVNPNGVAFSRGSSVDVGGLIASTRTMTTTDTAFLGGVNQFEFGSTTGLFVSNDGTITARGPNGVVALIGNSVSNSGTVTADGGSIGLLAGRRVRVDLIGDGLTTFVVDDRSERFTSAFNIGNLQADGGRVELIGFGVVNAGGVVQANSTAQRNGELVLEGGADGVSIQNSRLLARGGTGLQGGRITASGPQVGLGAASNTTSSGSLLDVSGDAGGGTVSLTGSPNSESQLGSIAFGSGDAIAADALERGNGGTVRLQADGSLRAYGVMSAKGGPQGGNGGLIETSGGLASFTTGGLDVAGLRVNASAPVGASGTWLIDPYNVTLVHGSATGTLAFNPYIPLANTTVQDGDIDTALNAGTNVTLTTGPANVANAANAAAGGDVLFSGATIQRTLGTAPLTFRIDASRSIYTQGPLANSIASVGAAGPLNVTLNSNANGNYSAANSAFGGYIDLLGMSLLTNGGSVLMYGQSDSVAGTAAGNQFGVRFHAGVLDTRIGRSDANAGGRALMRGTTTNSVVAESGIDLSGSSITTSTGPITLEGSVSNGDNAGVGLSGRINGNDFVTTSLRTTSGDITLTGTSLRSNIDATKWGVRTADASVATQSGNIRIAGRAEGAPADFLPVGFTNRGVQLGTNTRILNGSGSTLITGEATTDAAGLQIDVTASIQSSGTVVLRARNNGAGDALVVGGSVQATVLDLRPGGVLVTGATYDATGDAITLGGTADSGFAVSADELTRMAAGTVVVGSNTHAANIDVVGPVVRTGGLTLQNGTGGAIRLNGAVSAATLALDSAGNITQVAGAPVTATTLLARSTGGDVLLTNTANDVGTVGGSAADQLTYVDANALTLGPVSATGFDAGTNAAQLLTAAATSANQLQVRTLRDDLTLAGPVSGVVSTDLIAASRFQNPNAGTVGGAPWRVWANTWVGESRGGLAGSGNLPNLYNCAYAGQCSVTVSSAERHFIYVQQPVATVLAADVAREQGAPNPPLTYGVQGLILGDAATILTGALTTTADTTSPPGNYPITGTFASPAGYAVNTVPGSLTVTASTPKPKPTIAELLLASSSVDVVRDVPLTYTFDRNLGPAPMCFATGPLDGDRTQQGDDLLAREWSRVRSRPSLTNCVDTSRKNGCGDF